jgi:heptaprenyl diphosphate synthase
VRDALAKKILLAVMVCLAVAVNALENAAPIPLPWVRLGLANAVTLLVMVLYGFPEALLVSVARVLLGALVAGGLLGPAFPLSIGGALAAVLIMGLLARAGAFSVYGLSAAGAFAHTLTQFALLHILMAGGGPVMSLAPPFLLLSLPAGFFTGWLVAGAARALAAARPGSFA